jgi:anti-sigma factor RsiW
MTSLPTLTQLPPISRDDERALHAYADRELEAAAERALEARLAAESPLRAHLEEIRAAGRWVSVEAEREARTLPTARFEQLWDDLEAQLAKDAVPARAARAARTSATETPEAAGGWAAVWERLRWPAGFAAAAAAAAVVFTVIAPGAPSDPAAGQGQGGVAQSGAEDAVGADPAGRPAHAPRGASPKAGEGATGLAGGEASSPELRIAEASPKPEVGSAGLPTPVDDLPAPDSNDADIERIEFSGASGQISRIEGVRGTTTVIWVEEDDQPADSERSL